ncbi:MAG: hypothetical protein Q4D19_07915, partial [Lautropia sp.]|nr:hypothetical protein [Lautropia sp.]
MNPTYNDQARPQDNGMNDAANAFPEAVVPQGPRNSIRSLRKKPAAEPGIESKPKSSQDLQQGIRKEEDDEDRPAGWLNQEGTLPAEGTAGESAIGKATGSSTTGGASEAGQAAAGMAGETAGTAAHAIGKAGEASSAGGVESLVGKTSGSAGIAGGAGASGAASAGAKAAGAAQAAGAEAGALSSVGAKGAGSAAVQASAGTAGSTAGESFASNFWSSTSGKVAAVAGGVLAVAAAAGGGSGGSSDTPAQGSNPQANTKPDVNEGSQPGASQPPSSPQSDGSQEIAPTYGPGNVSKAAVAHDASVKMASAVFAGTGEPPAFIRITGITPNESSDGARALVMNQGTGDEKTLDVGAVISRADFDKISWDSAANNGGKFSFVALDSSQQPFDGLAEQTVEIRESRVAPEYLPNRPEQNLIHDTDNTLSASLFNGNDSNKAPDFIRITAVNPSNPANTDSALLLHADGAPQAKPVQVNDVIPAGEFDKISWNTANNEGGSFSFEALDADKQPILGSAPQTIVISEMPANAPSYPSTQPVQLVAHDQTLALPGTLLSGSDDTRKPHAILIESVDVQNPAEDTMALQIDRDGAGPNDPESLEAGKKIEQADFDKLSWDSAGNTGGRFSFSALDAQGEKIANVPIQTVVINESPEPPEYPGVSTTAVQYQSLHALSATVFEGDDDTKKPGFVRISAVNPQGGTPDANALFFDKDGPGGAAPTPVQDDQVISAADFGKLLWNSQAAPFGSISFEALDANKHPILDGNGDPVTQDVQVLSHP